MQVVVRAIFPVTLLVLSAVMFLSPQAQAEGNYYCFGQYGDGVSCDGPYKQNLKSNRVYNAQGANFMQLCAGRAYENGTALGQRKCGNGAVLSCYGHGNTPDARPRLKNQYPLAQYLQGYWAQHYPNDCPDYMYV